MKDKNKNLLILPTLLNSGEYNTEIIMDEQVNDCLFYLYLYLLDDSNDDTNEYLKKFNQLYESLSILQQEIVKNDYLTILEQRQKIEEDNNSVNLIKK